MCYARPLQCPSGQGREVSTVGERTRLGLGVLGVALALGGLGDVLLRATPWGINFLIWVMAIVGLAVLLAKWGRVGTGGEGKWLVFVSLVFAAGVVLRDSPVVVFLDLLGVLISLSLAVWLGRSGSLRRAGILDYVLGGVYTGVLTSAGPFPVSVADIEWREAARGRWKGQVLAVSRGVLLAAPLLLLFGALLVAADAIFERLIIEVFGFDLAEVFSHLFLITFFAWITAGLLWAGLMARVPENFAIPRPGVLSRHRRGRDSAHSSGSSFPDFCRDPGSLPVRRRGARGRHGGPDLRRVRPSRILRAGHRNGPRTPPLAHRPLATQDRDPRPRASVQGACRDNGSPALRRRGLRAAADVPLPARVRPDRATPLRNHIHGVDLRRPTLVRPHRAAFQTRPLRVRCPSRRFRRHLCHKRHESRCPNSKHQHRPHGRWKALRRLLPDHPERRRRARARRVSP